MHCGVTDSLWTTSSLHLFDYCFWLWSLCPGGLDLPTPPQAEGELHEIRNQYENRSFLDTLVGFGGFGFVGLAGSRRNESGWEDSSIKLHWEAWHSDWIVGGFTFVDPRLLWFGSNASNWYPEWVILHKFPINHCLTQAVEWALASLSQKEKC